MAERTPGFSQSCVYNVQLPIMALDGSLTHTEGLDRDFDPTTTIMSIVYGPPGELRDAQLALLQTAPHHDTRSDEIADITDEGLTLDWI